MRVRATERGYDGRELREVGDQFDFDGKLGSWMEAAGPASLPEATIPEPPAPPLPQLDHDGDGRPGGSRPQPADAKAERKALLDRLKAGGVKAFAGAPLDKLRAQVAALPE